MPHFGVILVSVNKGSSVLGKAQMPFAGEFYKCPLPLLKIFNFWLAFTQSEKYTYLEIWSLHVICNVSVILHTAAKENSSFVIKDIHTV